MKKLINSFKKTSNQSFRPVFFDIGAKKDYHALTDLLRSGSVRNVNDNIHAQLCEYIQINRPTEKLNSEKLENLVIEKLNGQPIESYGNWVYYPWNGQLVHLLPEEEFVQVRTSRNIYKIYPEELEKLRTKKIGIIGLSVGQSIALTMAMERTCGAFHLADFDDVELSNMNRIRVSVSDLGDSKTILAAREIAEIDPYLKVTIFPEGINEDNIDRFFTKDGKLDLLVEECDGLDVKINSRLKARELGIPVVMDTNDRGMLDIERFDLEPDRPLFHGGFPEDIRTDNLKQLSNKEKLPLLDAMADLGGMSERMKYSLSQLGKSINTWPQLASSVALGGAMVTDVSRRILLGQLNCSGRFFVDFESLINGQP